MVMTATKGYASLDAETGTVPLEQIDLDIARGVSLFDDFIAESASGNLGFSSLVSGPGSAVTVDISMNNATHFGFVKLTAGGGAAGRRATHYLGTANLVVGGGYAFIEQLIYIPTLATLAEDFGLQIGVGNVFTNADHNDGIVF